MRAAAVKMALAAALLAGCGSPTETPPDVGPPPPDMGPGITERANVFVAQGMPGVNLSAAMSRLIAETPEAPCTETPHGACVLQLCDRVAVLPTILANAGPVTVSSTGGSLTLEPEGDGYPDEAVMGPPLWAPGDDVTISAPGDVVPAFDTTVNASGSEDVLYDSPPLFFAGPTEVSRVTDLPVTWTAPDGSTAELSLILQSVGDTTAARARCAFPIAHGSGTIRATLLAALPGEQVNVTVGVGRIVVVGAIDWPVEVTVLDAVLTRDGLVASGLLALTE